MTDSIEWAPTREHSLPLRVCQDVPVAVLGGGALLAALASLSYVGTKFTQGSLAPLLVCVLLVLVGGPLSLLYLLPMLTDGDQRPGLGTVPQSPREGVALAVGGAIALAGTAIVFPPGLVGLVLGAVFVCPPLAGLLGADGRVDAATRTLTVGGRSASLDALVGVRRISIGSVTFLWLTYARGVSSWTAPHLVALPSDVERRVRSHVTAGITAPIDPDNRDDRRASNRTVQATLVTFSLLFLGVAVGQFFVADLPTIVAIWASSLLALFALVFLWLAVEEG